MVVAVDGRSSASIAVGPAYAAHSVGLWLTPGTYALAVSLRNDLLTPSCDRNLWIDSATLRPETEQDPLHRRTVAELRMFTDWLAGNRAVGYIGEVGWPDDHRGDGSRWNVLAERWYRDADAAGLWVTNWATGEWWRTSYNLASYEDRQPPGGVDSPNTQAAVIEAHPSGADYRRGVNVAGGAFGAPDIEPADRFSNANPGEHSVDYHYDRAATFRYLASRGVDLVRIEFRWERLQPQLGAPLDSGAVDRLRAVVSRARRAGLGVILDMHNFGGYYESDATQGVRRGLGSPSVTSEHFSDAWRRIAEAFRSERGLVGYGLMNEPVEMAAPTGLTPARVWEAASQAAVNAVRSIDERRTVFVAGYNWAAVQTWAQQHPRAWIDDPADNVRYEAHHYWDLDHSSLYRESYEEEVTALGLVRPLDRTPRMAPDG